MSARSCQGCAREDSASTPLAASSVNVQEATLSTQKPESVKVFDTQRLRNSQVTYSSLAHAKGQFSGKEIESNHGGLHRGHMGRQEKVLSEKKTMKYWPLLSYRQH